MQVSNRSDIYKHMSKSELEREISKYVSCFRYYQRLVAIKMITEGYSVSEVANELSRSYPTIHKWVQICENEGLAGLKPNFSTGGQHAKLSKNQLNELDEIIDGDPNLDLKDLRIIIKKKYDIDYSAKQVRIIAGRLGYDYRRQRPKFYKIPLNYDDGLD